jgi:hypothetical protein
MLHQYVRGILPTGDPPPATQEIKGGGNPLAPLQVPTTTTGIVLAMFDHSRLCREESGHEPVGNGGDGCVRAMRLATASAAEAQNLLLLCLPRAA